MSMLVIMGVLLCIISFATALSGGLNVRWEILTHHMSPRWVGRCRIERHIFDPIRTLTVEKRFSITYWSIVDIPNKDQDIQFLTIPFFRSPNPKRKPASKSVQGKDKEKSKQSNTQVQSSSIFETVPQNKRSRCVIFVNNCVYRNM